MKAKRFILMLLVALMSVTAVSAQALNNISYTIHSASSGHHIQNGIWYFGEGNLTGWVILKTPKRYILDKCEIPLANHTAEAEKAVVSGSNDATSWTVLGTWIYHYPDKPDRSLTLNPTVAYQYYKIEYSEPSSSSSPYLVARPAKLYSTEPNIEGLGTEDNPFIIKNPVDFSTLKDCQAVMGSLYAKVNNNIDFSSVPAWQSVDLSAAPFVLDGNCKELKNLKGTNGLFSKVSGATIKNLGIVDADINTTAACSGGFAAEAASSTFTNCYATGSFSNSNASAICGGVVGMASNNTKLTQCYSVTDGEIRPTFVSSTNTESYQNQPAQNLVDNGGVDTRWIADKSQMVGGIWNIVVTTGRATQLESIKLWNANNQDYPKRRWKSMKVYGSASSDDGWTEIGSFPNLQLAANNKGLAGEVAINATEKYAYYRIDVLDNEGDNYMQMSDMKFVVSSQNLQSLPVCGSTDGSCTANLCYHYGSTSSALSTSVEKADIASGRLAYLLNGSVDFATIGPYYQKLGSDLYPHLNSTGDNYVYTIDGFTFSNSCTHRSKNHYPFKAPTCEDNSGHIEYYQCKNELCNALLGLDGQVIKEEKILRLSMTAIVIKEIVYQNKYGKWTFKDNITKNGKTYYDVAQVYLYGFYDVGIDGTHILQYTFLDSGTDSLNIHSFQEGRISGNKESLKFYVNGTERTDLAITLKNEDNYHSVTTIKGLKKYDIIRVEFTNALSSTNWEKAYFYLAFDNSHKPGDSHSIQSIPCIYDCIKGGYAEHHACEKCGLEFEEHEEEGEEKEWQSMSHEHFLSAYYLEPTGEHDFVLSEQTTEQGLLKYACQRYTCKATVPDHFAIKNCIATQTVPITKDGNNYIADEPTLTIPDAVTYNSPISFSIENIEYQRTFYTNVWNPWFVPFATSVEELAGNGITDVATIESIHNYDTDKDGTIDKTVLEVILKKEGMVKSGLPYMVKVGDSYTYPMVFAEGKTLMPSTNITSIHSETASASYNFEGTYSGLNADDLAKGTYYSLDQHGAIAHRTQNILPQRWYAKEILKENPYDELSPAQARAFVIRIIGEEDESTGIRTIYPDNEQREELLDEGIFDLSGRKLNAPQHGKINIINGRKQFVK